MSSIHRDTLILSLKWSDRFRVLDGAILVISAVEGVQAQTKILMRTLQKLNIPTILFVNKIDRRGANSEKVVKQIKTILSNEAFPFTLSKRRNKGSSYY